MSNYNYYNNDLEYEIRKRKRAAKAEATRRKKKQQWYLRLFLKLGVPALLIITLFIVSIVALVKREPSDTKENEDIVSSIDTMERETVAPPDIGEVIVEKTASSVYSATETPFTTGLPSQVVSSYGILIDLSNDTILKSLNARTRISPASMTKILTVLVAAEHINESELDNDVKIILEFTDYSYKNDLSAVGFAENEVVKVRDLFYGTILPSGGDAGIALATYVAGSEEAFAEMMNDKLKELELSDSSHFTNCVGLYNDNHYSTVYDMAMILHAALDNPLCKEVLSTHTYTTTKTPEHPDGITISNWFLRRIEDKDCGMNVLCAKTGFVAQSKSCAVSYGKDTSGNEYVVCTQGSSSSWRCIYDHVAIYKRFEGKVNHGSSESVAESEEEMAEELAVKLGVF